MVEGWSILQGATKRPGFVQPYEARAQGRQLYKLQHKVFLLDTRKESFYPESGQTLESDALTSCSFFVLGDTQH